MQGNPIRRVLIAVGIVLAGLGSLAIQYVISPSALPEPGEYFLSELARAQIGPLSIVLAVACAFAFGYAARVRPVTVGLLMVAVFPLITFYEGDHFPGSHNLLPLELVVFLLWAAPLMISAWLGRSVAKWRDRRVTGRGSPDPEGR